MAIVVSNCIICGAEVKTKRVSVNRTCGSTCYMRHARAIKKEAARQVAPTPD